MFKYFQISIFVLISACAFVRFEVSPYVVRDVEIYYSAQEDVTFFFWKIKYDALLDNVYFERLDEGGDYNEVDLDSTLFPAAPFQCGTHWCFQFQQEGKYENDTELAPIRSVHTDQGIFAGSKPRLETVQTTFQSSPIGIENNNRIDPHLEDWFSENNVVLKREFEWQFRDAEENDCGDEAAAWDTFSGTIDSKHDWVESEYDSCFALRPKRSDAKGAELLTRLAPSAETTFEKQRYDVPTEKAHVVYGLLIDLEIPSEQRCKQIKTWLENTVESAMASNSETHKKLGVYTPLSTLDGEPLSGCEQRTQQDFPLAQMLQDATSELAIQEKPVRIIWIYANNINQAPAQRVLTQILAFQQVLSDNGALETYNLAIGSDFIIKYFQSDGLIPDGFEDVVPELPDDPFRRGIGWRPIEDQTFGADIRSWAKSTLPFHSMIHDGRTEIPIRKWIDAVDAQRFKICQSTPFEVRQIGVVSPIFRYTIYNTSSLAWPQVEDPFFSVDIEPQFLLPKKIYTRQRVDAVIEVCLRFCDSRFQTKTRDIFSSWTETGGPRPMEVCQWTE